MLGGSLGLMQAATALPAATNPDYSNVVLLLHMDGADGGTSFTDQRGHVFTANGNAQLSTASSKFGTSSVLFDGTGDWIDTPDSIDFALGAGDWTVECWVKTATTGVNQYIFGQTNTTLAYATTSHYAYITSAGLLTTTVSQSGLAAITSTGTTTINDGVYHHVAIVCASNVLKQYIDGIASPNSVTLPAAIRDSSYKYSIGRAGEYPSFMFNGSIEEFRLTKGVACYTSNFLPPTAPFPNS